MKNKLIILIIVVLVLVGFIWVMKPSDSVSGAEKSYESFEEMPMSKDIDSHLSSTAVANNQITSIHHDAENIEQNELIDTKSDLSIQPIDPATDPGNQIAENN